MLKTAEPECVLPGELRTQKEHLRRVIDPYQQCDDRSGGAEAGGHTAVAQIEPDRILSKTEQSRRENGAGPDIAP